MEGREPRIVEERRHHRRVRQRDPDTPPPVEDRDLRPAGEPHLERQGAEARIPERGRRDQPEPGAVPAVRGPGVERGVEGGAEQERALVVTQVAPVVSELPVQAPAERSGGDPSVGSEPEVVHHAVERIGVAGGDGEQVDRPPDPGREPVAHRPGDWQRDPPGEPPAGVLRGNRTRSSDSAVLDRGVAELAEQGIAGGGHPPARTFRSADHRAGLNRSLIGSSAR